MNKRLVIVSAIAATIFIGGTVSTCETDDEKRDRAFISDLQSYGIDPTVPSAVIDNGKLYCRELAKDPLGLMASTMYLNYRKAGWTDGEISYLFDQFVYHYCPGLRPL